MYIHIDPPAKKYIAQNDIGVFFDYLDKCDDKKYQQELDSLDLPNPPQTFFTQFEDGVSKAELPDIYNKGNKGLKKSEAKYFHININPSEHELRYIGNDDHKLKEYARNVMEAYAINFNKKGVNINTITWHAKIENYRVLKPRHEYFSHNKVCRDATPDEQAVLGRYYFNTIEKGIEKVFGEPQPHHTPIKVGMPIGEYTKHIHIVVKRLTTDGIRISPMTNHRQDSNIGYRKTGEFNREQFFSVSEEIFDLTFNYQRDSNQSYKFKKFNAVEHTDFAPRVIVKDRVWANQAHPIFKAHTNKFITLNNQEDYQRLQEFKFQIAHNYDNYILKGRNKMIQNITIRQNRITDIQKQGLQTLADLKALFAKDDMLRTQKVTQQYTRYLTKQESFTLKQIDHLRNILQAQNYHSEYIKQAYPYELEANKIISHANPKLAVKSLLASKEKKLQRLKINEAYSVRNFLSFTQNQLSSRQKHIQSQIERFTQLKDLSIRSEVTHFFTKLLPQIEALKKDCVFVVSPSKSNRYTYYFGELLKSKGLQVITQDSALIEKVHTKQNTNIIDYAKGELIEFKLNTTSPDFQKVVGKKVVLVDDLISSNENNVIIANQLKLKGIEVAGFASLVQNNQFKVTTQRQIQLLAKQIYGKDAQDHLHKIRLLFNNISESKVFSEMATLKANADNPSYREDLKKQIDIKYADTLATYQLTPDEVENKVSALNFFVQQRIFGNFITESLNKGFEGITNKQIAETIQNIVPGLNQTLFIQRTFTDHKFQQALVDIVPKEWTPNKALQMLNPTQSFDRLLFHCLPIQINPLVNQLIQLAIS